MNQVANFPSSASTLSGLMPHKAVAMGLSLVLSLFAAAATAATQYTYDELNRLTKVVYDDGRSISYIYDAAGNMTQRLNVAPSAVGDIVIPASAFLPSSVNIAVKPGTGCDAGLVFNAPPYGEAANAGEWAVEVPAPAIFRIEVEYSAQLSRPVQALMDGVLVNGNALADTNGTWCAALSMVKQVGVVSLAAGRHVFRLQRSSVFPHLKSIRFAALSGAYTLSTDFSGTANPSGAWTHGWTPTRGGVFTAFNSNVTPYSASTPTVKFWSGGTPYSLWVGKNTSTQAITFFGATVPAQGVAMHPGPNGEFAVSRWTAPRAGTFEVSVTFALAESAGTIDAYILKNGEALYGAPMSGSGQPVSHTRTVNVVAGDFIDFVVGNGGNGYLSDTTLVAAQVVPLP